MYISILLFVIGMIVLAWYLIKRSAGRMGELLTNGIETKAQVKQKGSLRGPTSLHDWEILYEYADQTGATHRHMSVVSEKEFDALHVGGSIDIVYSAKHPANSSPKSMVDLVRKAQK
jgi:hypothetical protein